MTERSETEVLKILATRPAKVTEVVGAIAAVRDQRLRAAIPAVLQWLVDSDIAIVDVACDAIVAVGAREAVPDLLDLLRPEAEGERRINCVVDPFGWYEPPPRESAALALGSLGAREAIPALVRLLGDELAGPREAAVVALGVLQAREAREAVSRLLEDESPRVQKAAQQALEAFGR
jgi:HEAT repeat protein